MDESTYDVIVVGGGFCGVHAAAEIERRMPDARVLLLEADRLGGRARSFDIPGGGGALDLGAHYLGPDHVRAMALAGRLLRKDELYSNVSQYGPDPGSRNFLDGAFRTTTKKSSFLELQGLSRDVGWYHRLRILQSLTDYLALEALIHPTEPWRTPGAAELDATTVAQWIASQRVPQWIRDLWGIAVLDIMSVWPDQISLLYWVWYNVVNGGFLKIANDHAGGPQELSITIGFEGLLARHAAELRGRVITGCPVVEVHHHEPARVSVVTASGTRFEARRVIIAASPGAVSRNITFLPELSPSRRLLHSQAVGHAVKAVFVYDAPWWRVADGLMLMSFSAGPNADGVEWALDTSHPAGHQFSLSAFASDKLLDRTRGDTAERDRQLRASMIDLCGDPRAGAPIHLEVFDWRDHRYVGGGPNTSFAPGVLTQVSDVWSRPEAPNDRLYFAAAEYATSFTGYVEGALASAEDRAASVAWDLQGELGQSRDPLPPGPSGPKRSWFARPAMGVARLLLAPAVAGANAWVRRNGEGRL